MIIVRCPLVPQRGSEKRKTADLRKKLDFAWRKSATKLLCVKTVSGIGCKAFIGLTNRAKIIGGGRPLVPEILDQSDRVGAELSIFALFSLVAPQP